MHEVGHLVHCRFSEEQNALLDALYNAALTRPLDTIMQAGVERAGLPDETVVVSGSVDNAREAFARQAWGEAYAALAECGSLEVEDLERLAVAAHLVGGDDESARAWQRAHVEWVALGDSDRAAQCAFWLGFQSARAASTASTRSSRVLK